MKRCSCSCPGLDRREAVEFGERERSRRKMASPTERSCSSVWGLSKGSDRTTCKGAIARWISCRVLRERCRKAAIAWTARAQPRGCVAQGAARGHRRMILVRLHGAIARSFRAPGMRAVSPILRMGDGPRPRACERAIVRCSLRTEERAAIGRRRCRKTASTRGAVRRARA